MLPNPNALIPPSNINATPTSISTIELTWNEVINATSYNIYRSLIENGTYTLIGNTTETTYVDTNLNQNTTYYYKLEAINAEEPVGILSEAVNATTDAIEAPDNLVVNTITPTTISFNWDPVEQAEGYNIYRSTNPNGPFTLINSQTTTSYIDTNLMPNTTYYYKVASLLDNIEGESSAPLSVTTNQEPTPTPTITLNAQAINCNTIYLSWTPLTNATTYLVFRSINQNTTFTFIGATSNTFFQDNNLNSNTTYYYQVIPYIGITPGVVSNTAFATTLPRQYNNCSCQCGCNCNPCTCCCRRRNWWLW